MRKEGPAAPEGVAGALHNRYTYSFAGSVHDDGELVRLEGGTTNEATVHVGLAEQLLRVLGVHAAAVLDGQRLGSVLTVQLAHHLADGSADFLCLVGGGSLAGADGPDGLVGDDHVLQLLGGDTVQSDLHLHADQFLGDTLLTLGQALAHADDGLQTTGQRRTGTLVDGLVGLGEVLTALAVADHHILHAQVGEHVGRDLAGEGTGLFKVDVLGTHMDVGATALGHRHAQVGEGHADDHFTVGTLHSGNQGIDQVTGLGGGHVHFPVAGDNGFTILFIHS